MLYYGLRVRGRESAEVFFLVFSYVFLKKELSALPSHCTSKFSERESERERVDLCVHVPDMLALLHLAPEGLTVMSPTARTSKMQPSRIRMDLEATRDVEVDVTSWQPASLAKVADTLGLTEKEYAAELGYDSFSLAGSTGSVRSYEGSGTPNVAWCSGLAIEGARASISAFCGPLTDVPHLIASVSISDGGIDLYIDWRPRADAAYDPACATLADYPEPADRDMFAQGSARKDFASCFYTEDAEAWRNALLAQGTPNPPLSIEQTATISAGPLLVDLRRAPSPEP